MKPNKSKAKNRPKARKPRSLSVAGGSADLAAKLARAIFKCGDDGDEPHLRCRRIQFRLGTSQKETPGGGFCEEALANFIRSEMRGMPNTKDQTDTHLKPPAQPDRD